MISLGLLAHFLEILRGVGNAVRHRQIDPWIMDNVERLAYLIAGHLPIPLTPEIYPLSALEDRVKSVPPVVSGFPRVYDLGYVEPMTKIHENRRVDFCAWRERACSSEKS